MFVFTVCTKTRMKDVNEPYEKYSWSSLNYMLNLFMNISSRF